MAQVNLPIKRENNPIEANHFAQGGKGEKITVMGGTPRMAPTKKVSKKL